MKLDIFCRVVDNFGDAGVCWRLARRMADGFGWQVRLLVDQPGLIEQLAPDRSPAIEVLEWAAAETAAPAQLVIEAFACDPPAAYVARMAQSVPAPVWLNLEYFTAERFALECHGLPSPQANGLTKYFFFPGVAPASGGLIASTAAPGRAKPSQRALSILLFCYPHAPVQSLLAGLEQAGGPVTIRVAAGEVAERLFGSAQLREHGLLSLQKLPFLPQTAFDAQIAGCDLAFVRGEDSIARALLAGTPFVWNIYRQEAGAHLPKLAALLDWWCAGLDAPVAAAVRQIHAQWNSENPPPAFAQALQPLLAHLPALKTHARAVAGTLALEPDLGSRLSEFVRKKLNS